MARPKPVVEIIMDGWGISQIKEGNAIAKADTPNIDNFYRTQKICSIQASGIAVGLFWGEAGNSEVGHLNLGSGRVIYQDLPRITLAIRNNSFSKNEMLLKAINNVKQKNSALHLMGLVSNGGVHSHIDHLLALLDMAGQNRLQKVYIHMFTDGRDTAPKVALKFLNQVEEKLKTLPGAEIATVSGRYFAMDRNNNWDRTELAYNAIALGKGKTASSAREAIENSYKEDVFDEHIKPTVIFKNGSPVSTINSNDSIIFFNFRPDRARQLTKAFILPGFTKFERTQIKPLCFVTMTEYEKALPVDGIAFPEEEIKAPLAKIISDYNLKQLHIAETEKYAHVTYFFNGGQEKPFPGEDHVLIPSPSVKTYDEKPEMNALEVTDRVIKEINAQKYDFILINFANGDMVGHTGNFEAAKKAASVVDECVAKVARETLAKGGELVVTADHGNLESMINPQTGEIEKEHTTSPVPFIYISSKNQENKTDEEVAQILASPLGVLADVAPTVLAILELPKPDEMTGISLIESLR